MSGLFARATSRLLMTTVRRSMASETSGKLNLTFSSPAATFYKGVEVKQVDVPSYSGSLGILADHVPILAVMKPGVVTVHEMEGQQKKYFVAAGTVTMNEDSTLLLLASEAVPVEDLDVAEAQKNLGKSAASNSVEDQIKTEVNQAIVSMN